MSIWAPISFYICMGIFVLWGLWHDKRHKKTRTRSQQIFVHWYEFTCDYGYWKDLTQADHKRYRKIIRTTVNRNNY